MRPWCANAMLAVTWLTSVSPGAAQTTLPVSAADVKTQVFGLPRAGALEPEQPAAFSVMVQGRSDGPMYADPPGTVFPWRQRFYNSVSLSLTNRGQETVKSPWLVKAGQVNGFSLGTLVAGICRHGMSDREKARAIYEFDQANRFHDHPQNGGDHLDPVKYYNVYGYGICGDDATVLAALYAAAGLKARDGWPMGHSTVEVLYDQSWHLLDSDLCAIVLKADNTTIAAEEDIARDPFLMMRTHTYGFKYLLPWDLNRDAFAAGLQWYLGPRERVRPTPTGHTMAFDLRPGETITWRWEERRRPVGNIVMSSKRDYAGKHFHGVWRYELSQATLETCRSGDGFVVPFQLPYPIVGARVESTGDQRLAVSANGRDYVEAGTGEWRTGIVDDDLLKLLGLNRDVPPPYALWFRLPVAAAAAMPVRFHLDFQAAPKALPQLALGENRFLYTDAAAQRDVEVTVQWRENQANAPPSAPGAPPFPADQARVKGSEITFTWSPATDPDGHAIADYHLVLSEFPDCRYALSSNFHVLLSETAHKGTTAFQTPWPGLLNPAKKYYWRVRARDEQDCWGPWGPVWSFEVEAPGTPQPAAPAVDDVRRLVKLRWAPGPGGTPAVKYRLYGSNYRGFTPSRGPHKMLSESANGGQKFTDLPANLLGEVDRPEWDIAFADPQKLRAFYRIQAVDAEGTAGCCSPQIEVPGPILLSAADMRLQPGQVRVPLTFLASAGRLANTDGGAYTLYTVFQDTWRVEMISPAGMAAERREPGCVRLAQPLAAGQDVKVRVRVTGASYCNREQQREFDLSLVGGGPGEWTAEPPRPPSRNRVLLRVDLGDADLARHPQLKVEEPGFVVRQVAGRPALSLGRPTAADRSYARVACPLALTAAEKVNQDGAKGRIIVSFSLFWDTHARVDRHEVHLLQKDGQWTYLSLMPWNAVTITQKLSGKGTVSRRSPAAFNYPYGELVSFRWEIEPDGTHRVFQAERLLFETRDLPGRDGFLQFRVAAVIGQPNPGTMGFGPVMIEQVDAAGQ